MTQAPALKIGGTLGLKDLYIHRSEDDLVFQLLADREYCNVLTSRQMGKSSLMVRLIHRLSTDLGARIATVDMAGDLGTPPDAEAWYIGFLEKLALDLDLDQDVRGFWQEQGRGTLNQRLLGFLKEVVGGAVAEPVYVFVDEVDATLKLPYSDDFFTALRSMYNQRATVPEYGRITFCLLGVAAPGELIKDRRTTPYNIGRTVELRDFDPARDDLTPLFAAMSEGGAPGGGLVRAVLGWTGGHPFLTLAVCGMARRRGARSAPDVEQMMEEQLPGRRRGRAKPGAPAAAAAGSAADALKAHFDMIHTFLGTRLQHEAAALRIYDRLLRGRNVEFRATPPQIELCLAGLAKRDAGGRLVARNRVYSRHFSREWLAQTRPMRAYVWAIRLSIPATILLSTAIGVGVYYANRGDEERARAEERAQKIKELRGRIEDENDEDSATSMRLQLCDLVSSLSGADLKRERDLVRSAWRKFWDKPARRLEKAASDEEKKGDVERALVLAALASVKRGEDLAPEWERRYKDAYGPFIIGTFRGHVGAVHRARFLDARHIVSLGSDNTLRLHELDTGKELNKLSLEGLTSAIDLCRDGSCVLAMRSPEGLKGWEGDRLIAASNGLTMDSRYTIGDIGKIHAVAIGPSTGEQQSVAIGDDDGRVYLGDWPAASGAGSPSRLVPRGRPLLHRDAAGLSFAPVYSVEWSEDYGKLYTATTAGIYEWRIDGGRGTLVLEGSAFHVRRSPNSARLLASLLGSVKMYDPGERKDDRIQTKLVAEEAAFLSSEFSPDGKEAVSGAVVKQERGLLVIWRTQDGEERFRQETPYMVRDVDFSPDRETEIIVYAYAYKQPEMNGAVRVLRVKPEEKPPQGPALWTDWQKKFGYTVDGKGQVVPLGPDGPKPATGYSEPCMDR